MQNVIARSRSSTQLTGRRARIIYRPEMEKRTSRIPSSIQLLISRDMVRRQVETESSCSDDVRDIVHLLQQHLLLEARDVRDTVLALYRISKMRNRRQSVVHPDVPL